MDYYSLLNLSRNCTLTDLKAAYRKLSFKHHPDLGGDQEMMKKVNLAYEQIKWELEKRDYRQSTSKDNYSQAKTEQPPKDNYSQAKTEQPPKDNYSQAKTEQPPKDNYSQAKTEQPPKDNYSQAKTEQPPRPEPEPAEPVYPDSKKPIKEWVEIIESLFADQVRAERKPSSVAFYLMDNWEKPPLVIWEYLAKRLRYQKGWAYHQHRRWKPSVWADQD
jgi:DnaJ domain